MIVSMHCHVHQARTTWTPCQWSSCRRCRVSLVRTQLRQSWKKLFGLIAVPLSHSPHQSLILVHGIGPKLLKKNRNVMIVWHKNVWLPLTFAWWKLMRRMDLPCQLALEPTCVMMWKVTVFLQQFTMTQMMKAMNLMNRRLTTPKNVLVIALSCRFMFLALRHACMVLYVCFCFGLQHVYGHVVLIQGSWPSTWLWTLGCSWCTLGATRKQA